MNNEFIMRCELLNYVDGFALLSLAEQAQGSLGFQE